jgi:rhodanese-related sulfurtransferase
MDFSIPAEDVKAALDGGEKLKLLDVREPWEYEVSRIAGSTLMPMGDVPSRAHQELDPDERIIVFCHRGVRSMSVVKWLREQGFENSQSMSGGIDRWSRAVDPKVPLY